MRVSRVAFLIVVCGALGALVAGVGGMVCGAVAGLALALGGAR